MNTDISAWARTASWTAAAAALSLTVLGTGAKADVTYTYTSDLITAPNDPATHQYCDNWGMCTGRIVVVVTFPGTPDNARFVDQVFADKSPMLGDPGRIQHLSISAFGLMISDRNVKDRNLSLSGEFTIEHGVITDWTVLGDSERLPNCKLCNESDMRLGHIHLTKNPKPYKNSVVVYDIVHDPDLERRSLISVGPTNLQGQWSGPVTVP